MLARTILTLLVALLLPATGVAKVSKPAEPSGYPPYVEQLIATPPAGWKQVFQVNVGGTRIADYVPKGQTRKHWTAKLSFESYAKLLHDDPLVVTKNQARYTKKHCSFASDYSVFAGLENNYPTATRLLICGRLKKTDKGQISLFKAIKGEQYFYIIRMVRRLPPFENDKSSFDKADMAAWSHYFSKIRVCDPGSNDHPCPRPGKH